MKALTTARAEISIETRVVALEAAVVDLRRQLDERTGDDARLLHAIARVFGSRVFSARTVRIHARIDRESAAGRDLGAVVRWLTTAALGRRFRSLRDRPCHGYVLRRDTRDEDGAWWTLHPVDADDRHDDAGLGRRTGV